MTKWVPRGPSCVTGAQLNYSTQNIDGLGRGVVSGRISAIALSPDGKTIYAGAASGGVWRSKDDGAHWVPLMDDQPTLAVGAIAVAADGTVYVGTGEANDVNSSSGIMTGVGILRSVDEGATWSRVSSGTVLERTRIARIVIHPDRPNELYAATSAGLFVSTDRVQTGMDTFHLFELGSASKPSCTDVVVDFTDHSAPIVYAGFLDTGIFKVQANLGDDSIPVEQRFPFGAAIPKGAFDPPIEPKDAWRISLAMAPAGPNIVYAVFAGDGDLLGVYRSDNRGASWQDWGTHTFGEQDRTDFMSLLAVDPRDPEIVFFGDERLWRRAPGKSWHIVSAKRGDYPGVHDDQHVLVFDRNDPAIVWLGNDGGVWKSTDGGEHFYARNRGLAIAQLYAMAQFPGEPAVVLAGTQDLGAVSTRGHAAWREFVGGDAFFVAIEPARPRFWYIGPPPEYDLVVRFPEGDANRRSWKRLSSGTPAVPPDPSPFVFVVHPQLTGPLYLGGTDTLYWWRGRDASSWEPIEESSDDTGDPKTDITAIAVARLMIAGDPETVYIGRANGDVHRLDFTDDEWWPVANGMLPVPKGGDDRCQAIAVDPHDRDHFFVTIGNVDGPDSDDKPVDHRIWSGRFGGGALTFTPFADLPDVEIDGVTIPAKLNHVNALVLDPVNIGDMYAGTDYGVYRWNPVTGWLRFSDGLPAALVVTQMYLDADTRRLQLSSMGRGVWECMLARPDRNVDLFVRDCELDDGTQPTLAERQHPVTLGVVHWTDGPDIKLDTERMLLGGFESLSTVTYDGTGEIDHLGFEALDSDRPRGRADSRVYVQIHNRGPQPATQVRVRLFWALKTSAGYPDLPPDFWARHLGDTFETAHWKPLGPAQTLDEVVPGTPRVARFDWTASGSNDTIGILAVVSCADDPLPAGLTLVVEDAVRAAKHVALRETVVNPATYKIVLEVLAVVGLVVLAAVEAPKLL